MAAHGQNTDDAAEFCSYVDHSAREENARESGSVTAGFTLPQACLPSNRGGLAPVSFCKLAEGWPRE
jgi:hypothetical protein